MRRRSALGVVVAAVVAGTLALLAGAGCGEDFSLDEVPLTEGLELVRPEGWLVVLHPHAGYELVRTGPGRVRRANVLVFPRTTIAATAGTDDPAADAFAGAVEQAFRERIRAAIDRRRGLRAPLQDYFAAYAERDCRSLEDRGRTWHACMLRRTEAGHPAWYNLHTVTDSAVVLVTAFAARDDGGEAELSDAALHALLAPVRPASAPRATGPSS
ncbi:MAG: hypothetical protein R6X25_05915 [Candidatus Krumholzibacteriia bacterium]